MQNERTTKNPLNIPSLNNATAHCRPTFSSG